MSQVSSFGEARRQSDVSRATQFDVLVNVRSALLEDFLGTITDCQRQSPQSWGRGSAPDVLSRAFRLFVLSTMHVSHDMGTCKGRCWGGG